ncbi:unnamed protein product [Phaedon cochleariae]|uniref:Helitron helicase-like domain-containing protein n=1 Tax=Phaedon cochleariae TaxID=80249 RepID=A0A9N9SFN4_PHACE|nr:unnamed protein product [Phaedon cochleariae]
MLQDRARRKNNRVGKIVIPPSTLVGGERNLQRRYRGLPHAHIFLNLIFEDQLNTEASIDPAVCADLPDADGEPRLYDIILHHMIHKPCGRRDPTASGMMHGHCKKFYPKEFRTTTNIRGNQNRLGQPEYKRPDDGWVSVMGGHLIDNSDVIPYNKLLSIKYDCHLNVELCGSLKSISHLATDTAEKVLESHYIAISLSGSAHEGSVASDCLKWEAVYG